MRVRVQARVLRTIDKVGGLDEYLLGDKEARIRELGVWGWRLRWRVMQTPAVRSRFAEERKRLGLLDDGDAGGEKTRVGMDGRMLTEQALESEVEEFDKVLDGEDKKGVVILGDALGKEDVDEDAFEDENIGKGFMAEDEKPDKSKIKL